jgi:uncharacterized membrane protein YGL010W
VLIESAGEVNLAQAVMVTHVMKTGTMKDLFSRQLAAYARYHRDNLNCVTHYLGIPMIIVAILVVLALRSVPVAGINISLGTILLIPAVMAWIALDLGIGSAMLVAIVPLAAAATWIARSSSVTCALLIALGLFAGGWILQFVGHGVFERRKPAFVDDISRLFIGPMFIMAKILICLGLRKDLVALLDGKDDLAVAHRPRRKPRIMRPTV